MVVNSLRLPDELHRKVKQRAQAMGVSMHQYYLQAVSSQVAHDEAWESLMRRRHRGRADDLPGLLAAEGADNLPLPGDELPRGLARGLKATFSGRAEGRVRRTHCLTPEPKPQVRRRAPRRANRGW